MIPLEEIEPECQNLVNGFCDECEYKIKRDCPDYEETRGGDD